MNILAPSLLAARMLFTPEPAPEPTDADSLMAEAEAQAADEQAYMDSVLNAFTFQHGTVELANGVATLNIPPGFKFLDGPQSSHVIVDLWGNPDAEGVMGMILPEQDNVLADSSYAFVVQYDEMGYVKDDDADDIDYDDMLKELQEGETEINQERTRMGYEPIHFIGWAAKPFYDSERKVLHWAKELQFGDSATVNTLNYNVRVLGRKGVLVLNAVATMPQLTLVQQHIPDVLGIVQFNDGYRYDQFDSKVDNVAAWTVGGLVAGKVLAKAGIFAFLLKFLKVILIAVGAAGAGIWRFFTGRKKKQLQEAQPRPTDLTPPAPLS